jgi:hypothetical protein
VVGASRLNLVTSQMTAETDVDEQPQITQDPPAVAHLVFGESRTASDAGQGRDAMPAS